MPDRITFDAFTPEQRTRALYFYFGWQGGTIHQLAQATGCTVDALLYSPAGDTRSAIHLSGFSAIRTCEVAWRCDRLAPQHQGEWAYWRDAILGFWATGPLDEFQRA